MNSNEPDNHTKINVVKVEIEKLFKEVMDAWLLQVHYSIEVGSMNPSQAEKKALEQYKRWAGQLARLLEKH